MSATIAFKYEFKTADLMVEQSGTPVKIAELEYANLYRQIVIGVSNERGVTADEAIRAVEALEPLKAAKKAGADHMLLTKEEYDFLLKQLQSFRFGVAHEEVVVFIKYIRNLPRVDLTPTPA